MTWGMACAWGLACAFPVLAGSPLDGAWRLRDGAQRDEQGRMVPYAPLKLQATKVLADGHFSFTTLADGRFWAAGAGTYELASDRYVERPVLASYPLPADGRFEFRYTLEGDVWTLERFEKGERVEREVWERAPSPVPVSP